MSESIISGVRLANSSVKSKRRELDFYPTPADVTHALMGFLKLEKSSVIWEPACGDGAMSKVIETYCDTVISTDIRSTGYGEGGVDFLTTERSCDAIITNPPFSLSGDFIDHSVKQSRVVAMLLKSQYWHAAKRRALFEWNPPAYVLPLTWRPDFMGGERGGAPTMEVHWTVWIRGEYDTRYRQLHKSYQPKREPK